MGKCISKPHVYVSDEDSEDNESVAPQSPHVEGNTAKAKGTKQVQVDTKETNGKQTEEDGLQPKPGIPNARHFGLQDTHVVLDVLGTGGEGSAWLMREKATGKLCAVKLIKRPVPRVLLPFLNQEISIQAQLGKLHENIIDLEGIILTPSFLAIVLEYASGGPLTSYICKRIRKDKRSLFLSEDEALYFFKQFIFAVEFTHRHGFAHRDLKLDNTLLNSQDPPTIKISDFGFAKGSAEENTFTTIGTPCYMSPEVLTSKTTKAGYNPKRADVWASGVLLFAMLYGTFPFDSTGHDPNSITTVHDILEQQLATLASKSKEPLKLPGVDTSLISEQCQDLLQQMFTLDPAARITIAEIKQHPWYNQPLPPALRDNLENIVQKQMKLDMQQKQPDQSLPPSFAKDLQILIAEAAEVSNKKGAAENQSIWLPK